MNRLSESRPGRLLGIVLALLWIASMSVADANACTQTPLLWALVGVLLCGSICLAAGYKVVRLPLTAWLGLLGGCYYLARAALGFSQTDNWADMGLVLGGIVYYIAGIYCGQTRSSRSIGLVLGVAILLNIAAMVLIQYGQASLHWIGRTDVALTGPNTRNTALFAYKNFAGLFLSASGILLLWRSIWRGYLSAGNVLTAIVGIAGIAAAFFCGSRAVWLVLALLFTIGWLLWLIIRLYSSRPLSWGIILGGMLLLTGICMVVYDFLFERNLLMLVNSVDTHTRSIVWEFVCRAAAHAPLYGYGPAGAVWEIVPVYTEWTLPNAAHNEYVQLWADYGVIGVGLAFLLLLLHVVQGIRALACDELCKERRIRTAMALLGLTAISAAAATDYVWHSFALTAMTAFCCGTLVSPIPTQPLSLFQSDRHRQSAPAVVRAQGRIVRLLLSLCGLLLAFCTGRLALTLTPAWSRQWQYDAMVAQQATAEAQRSFLLEVLPYYPHFRITDHIIYLAPDTEPEWEAYERGLRSVLQANPRQLFTASVLAQVLTRKQRYTEAEQVYRSHYPGDGPDNVPLSCWATFYAAHLQQWGHHLLSTSDDIGLAYSILTHAEAIAARGGYIPGATWRNGVRTWTQGGSAREKARQKAYKQDLQLLHAINPEKNDSWKQPLTPGGKPALYQRCQKTEK